MANKAIFLDCTDELKPLWDAVCRPGDPAIEVNLTKMTPERVPEVLGGHSILIDDHTYFDAALLGRCPGLKRIVFLGTGAASFIDLAAAAKLGIAVDTIKGYGDTAVAEHAIALLFAAARRVARMDRETRAGSWRNYEGMQLRGKRLGLIGLGGIGREMARLGLGIGLEVVAWNRTPLADSPVPLLPLDEVLRSSDILSLHLLLGEETHGFLDRAKLARTKPGLIFVNTARAAIVDQAALVDLLCSGHIREAALDVFTSEPPAADDPLVKLDNVTITAHAGFLTREATMTMLRRSIELVAAAP